VSAKVSAKAQALRLLALREHSRKELERKLMSRARPLGPGAPGGADMDLEALEQERQRVLGEVTSALDHLEQHGLLSDSRAADALLSAKSPRYGSRRLKVLLQAKSLDPALVSSTLARARETELERAQEVWRRRFGAPAADLKGRAKQQRFLAGRGFEAGVIELVLKAASPLQELPNLHSPSDTRFLEPED
jgi:regulatory protein